MQKIPRLPSSTARATLGSIPTQSARHSAYPSMPTRRGQWQLLPPRWCMVRAISAQAGAKAIVDKLAQSAAQHAAAACAAEHEAVLHEAFRISIPAAVDPILYPVHDPVITRQVDGALRSADHLY